MKKLFKSAANFLALAVMAVAAFSFSACEDIKKLELSLNVYDFTNSVFYEDSDVKLTVDLYRHLAPETVDKVVGNIKAGYYDNAIFYQETGYSSQIMIGDLKMENGELKLNRLSDGTLPSEIYGEFENNGTTGSDLVSKKGSIGVWRSYYETDKNYKTSSDARDSGRATWYIPTSEISGYNEYFCVFAQYDTDDTANSKAISAITDILSNNSTEYVIYYTGTYDADNPNDKDGYGLTFNAMKKEYFDNLDEEPEMFEAEGKQLVCFNKKTVKIPNLVDGKVSAMIKSAKVK